MSPVIQKSSVAHSVPFLNEKSVGAHELKNVGCQLSEHKNKDVKIGENNSSVV